MATYEPRLAYDLAASALDIGDEFAVRFLGVFSLH
jgi:hypothetical protein